MFDHVTVALNPRSGARPQILHGEEDTCSFFPPKPDLIVAKKWPLADFRADSGATLLLPDALASCVGANQARRRKP